MTLADTVRPKTGSEEETVTKPRMFFGARRERYVTSHQSWNNFSAIQQHLHMTLTNALSTLRIVPLKGEPMKNVTTRSIAVLALVGAMGISIPSLAYASSSTTTTTNVPKASFVAAQKAIEVQLASRATQLQHLVADVTAATSLPASASSTLQARLSTEESSINSLIAKVPTDTTKAELNADRAAMFKDNRVYAVMSPQVFEMIEASVVAIRVTTMQGDESTLQSETASLVGLPGYKNALNHYNNYVARLSNWSTRIVAVEGVVLAQTPQGYPGNTKIFVARNHQILDANIALAYAAYDASIIGLATGGYTGS
jgi:hypothetical protein